MVRKSKRKSEGDLPNSRLKARKSGEYRSGLEGEEREEGFDAVADWVDRKGVRRDGREKKDVGGVADQVDKKSLRRDGKEKKKEKKRGRMSEPARIGGRELGEREDDDEDEDDGDGDEDEDEDSGQEASNEFLELDNLERKKKKSAERAKAQFMEKFIGAVERDVKDFKESAAELEREASVENKDFLEGFHAAYSLSAPFKTVSYDFSLNHKKGRIMITRALELSSQFDNLTRKDIAKELAGLFGNEWSKEDGEIATMLELGKMVGLNKFECIVNASKPEILETEALEVSKKFYPAVEEESSTGWGKEARKHERAHKKLLKAFESRS
ncbi:uncharacterized protein EAE98_010443 [Botrytis deweyae]|uniref:Uncharacterized protein n=1 Tax=Botrytis deweyae TaxID=2478750 RepID=A0ABQ7I8X7_9HELO|nr:uncharacterized protein EAE98_010443 [Botrytis deweyae]KAF7917012.1 hypothetical protein EAE98_010443 [Botrytis deweyae]